MVTYFKVVDLTKTYFKNLRRECSIKFIARKAEIECMLKRNYVIFVVFCFLVMFMGSFLSSCKTKKAPFVLQVPKIEKLEEKTVVVQVCDKFQMSYNGLSCTVYFSDDSSASYTTAIDGKIAVKVPIGDVEIEKIEYDFSTYKPRAGQLLASKDFKLATRILSSPLAKATIVEGTFSSEIKNLFVLVR